MVDEAHIKNEYHRLAGISGSDTFDKAFKCDLRAILAIHDSLTTHEIIDQVLAGEHEQVEIRAHNAGMSSPLPESESSKSYLRRMNEWANLKEEFLTAIAKCSCKS